MEELKYLIKRLKNSKEIVLKKKDADTDFEVAVYEITENSLQFHTSDKCYEFEYEYLSVKRKLVTAFLYVCYLTGKTDVIVLNVIL